MGGPQIIPRTPSGIQTLRGELGIELDHPVADTVIEVLSRLTHTGTGERMSDPELAIALRCARICSTIGTALPSDGQVEATLRAINQNCWGETRHDIFGMRPMLHLSDWMDDWLTTQIGAKTNQWAEVRQRMFLWGACMRAAMLLLRPKDVLKLPVLPLIAVA